MTARRQARFPGDPQSVPEARAYVAEALAGMPGEAVETASLLVSELATNALVHASSSFNVRARRLALRRRLRVSVTDSGPGRPSPRHPAPSVEHGRGLQLVDAFSERWGVNPRRRGSGKTVWFDLPIGTPPDRPFRARRARPRDGGLAVPSPGVGGGLDRAAMSSETPEPPDTQMLAGAPDRALVRSAASPERAA